MAHAPTITNAMDLVKEWIGTEFIIDADTNMVYYYPDELDSALQHGRIQINCEGGPPVHLQKFDNVQ